MSLQPFHLAIQVRDIEESRAFYGSVLGCAEGRSSDTWVDFDLYGHQLVTHLNTNIGADGQVSSHANPVDEKQVPVPHFGVVMELKDWDTLAKRLEQSEVEFVIEPTIRFAGKPGEQRTMFFADPSGNVLEFKAFASMDMLFAK